MEVDAMQPGNDVRASIESVKEWSADFERLWEKAVFEDWLIAASGSATSRKCRRQPLRTPVNRMLSDGARSLFGYGRSANGERVPQCVRQSQPGYRGRLQKGGPPMCCGNPWERGCCGSLYFGLGWPSRRQTHH